MARKKKVEEEEVYHVEVITKARVSVEKDWEYYVKWAGYDSDADTWEPAKNVAQCERLLHSFWAHIGHDNKDYNVGHVFLAKDYWIKQEKEFFATQFAEDAKRQREMKNAKQATKATEPKQVESDTDSSEEPDIPLKQLHPVTKTSTMRGKKRKNTLVSSDSDSYSSEDRPLTQRRKQTHSKSRSTTAEKQCSSAAPAPNTSSAEQPSRPLPPPPRPSTSSSIPPPNVPRPPKIQPVRTHQDQRTNPLVKAMELPSKGVQSGSSLTTKQRIAAGSGPCVAPKPKPLQAIPKPKLLTNLTFKKNPPEAKDPTSATSLAFKKTHFENEPLSASGVRPSGALTQEPSSTTIPFKKKPFENEPFSASDVGTGPSATTPVGASPSSATKQTTKEPSVIAPGWEYNAETFEAVDDNFPPPSSAPLIQHQLAKPAPPRRAPEKAADEFLQSLSLDMPGLGSPLEPSVSDGTQEVDSFRPKALTTLKASAMPKIPKKWKWEGDLFVDFAKNQAEKVCEVTIKDATDSRDSGARMSFMMAQTDSIRIQKLYNVTDLTPVFRACGEAQQFAKLEALENQDSQASQALHGLFRHMSGQRQVAVLPLSLDGAELALLFIFSSSLDALCKFLRVPERLRQDSQNTHVLVALLPWLVSSAKYSKGTTHSPVDETIQQLSTPSGQSRDSRRRIMREAAMAIDLLSIPRELLDFMQLPNRKYCIWSFPADGAALNPGFETRQLKYVLDKTKAASVSLDAEARVIFIHVGALRTFYELSAVVTKRRDAPEVRFFTYGTHESVPSSMWGMREIFPLGGIVTFTPLAIAEDPVGCHNLMRNLAQHPLWECYLIPSIVGLSHALACGKNKPVPEIKSMNSCLLPILDLADAGSVSVTKAPTRYNDIAWSAETYKKQLLEVDDVLEECITSSMERFAHCSESDILGEADREISQDFINMELQPIFMDNYRRFVVIRAASEETRSLPEGGSGLEWSSISSFAFKDDYFLGL